MIEALKGADPDDRRKYLRIPAPIDVRFRVGDATITARAADLGLGGLSLRGHLWVIADQTMRIDSVTLDGRDYPLQLRCRVAWRVSAYDGQPRAGLQFVDLDAKGRAQIRPVFEALLVSFLRSLLGGDDESGGQPT